MVGLHHQFDGHEFEQAPGPIKNIVVSELKFFIIMENVMYFFYWHKASLFSPKCILIL